MVSTRRQSISAAWMDAMQTAAKLPDEVVVLIVDCCCAAASLDTIDPQTWAVAHCSSTCAGLDRLRRVNRAFNERISTHPGFLQLLACERLRAFERMTWTKKDSLSQKKLPKSFTLRFSALKYNESSSGSSSGSTARFHIHKNQQYPRWLVVEARHGDCTPAQVLELLRLMCHVQGRVCAMMYVLRIDKQRSPADWQNQITSGAQAIKSPVAVNTAAADDWVRFYPDSKQFVHMAQSAAPVLHHGTPAMDWGGNDCDWAGEGLNNDYRLVLAKTATNEQVVTGLQSHDGKGWPFQLLAQLQQVHPVFTGSSQYIHTHEALCLLPKGASAHCWWRRLQAAKQQQSCADPTGYEVSQASCAEGSFFTSKAAGQDEDFWDMDSAGEQTSWSWPASDKAASREYDIIEQEKAAYLASLSSNSSSCESSSSGLAGHSMGSSDSLSSDASLDEMEGLYCKGQQAALYARSASINAKAEAAKAAALAARAAEVTCSSSYQPTTSADMAALRQQAQQLQAGQQAAALAAMDAFVQHAQGLRGKTTDELREGGNKECRRWYMTSEEQSAHAAEQAAQDAQKAADAARMKQLQQAGLSEKHAKLQVAREAKERAWAALEAEMAADPAMAHIKADMAAAKAKQSG